MGKEMKNGTLVLNVIHGKEMEVEYNKNEIIDKINSFFGYNCINDIKLKIVQNKIDKQNKILQQIIDLEKIEENMKKINDDSLKKSLDNFVKAFNEKNK